MVGFEPTPQKTWFVKDAICLLEGFSPFAHLQKVNQLPTHTKPSKNIISSYRIIWQQYQILRNLPEQPIILTPPPP